MRGDTILPFLIRYKEKVLLSIKCPIRGIIFLVFWTERFILKQQQLYNLILQPITAEEEGGP